MSDFTKPLPEWNNPGIEPPQNKKDAGWQPNEKPPADYLNWFQHTTKEAIKETRDKIGDLSSDIQGRGINILHPPAPLLGVKGDGVTDDATAFQALLNFAHDNDRELIIPNGKYKINKSLDVRVSLLGVSKRGVYLDFSSNPDIHCIYANSRARLTVGNFTIKANPNISNQYALYVFYTTDDSSYSDIVVEDDCPNGIYISRAWYLNFSNIRLRGIKPSGHGIKLYNYIDGGVNACQFSNIYVQGGLHSVVFDGEGSFTSQTNLFIGCTFEGSVKTAIKSFTSKVNNIKFGSCYFENIYTDSVDSDTPVLCDHINTTIDPILFENCSVRATKMNNRVLVKGFVVLKDVRLAVDFALNNDNVKCIVQDCQNINLVAKNYFNSIVGASQTERIGVKEASYLYKKCVNLKTLVESDNNTVVPIFKVKAPVNSTCTALRLRLLIMSTLDSKKNTVAEYLILANGRGSLLETKSTLLGKVESNTNLFSTNFTLQMTTIVYDASTYTYDFTVSVNPTHTDFIGRYLIEVEGINSSDAENTNKRIEFL